MLEDLFIDAIIIIFLYYHFSNAATERNIKTPGLIGEEKAVHALLDLLQCCEIVSTLPGEERRKKEASVATILTRQQLLNTDAAAVAL